MALDTRNYLKMVQDLFPRGFAWASARNIGTDLYKIADSIKEEFSRVGQRGADLLVESDPSQAIESQDDWERYLGLPDECTDTENSTVVSRRREILAKLTGRGSISKQYYIDLAAFLGFTIEIEEYRPFRAGLSEAGELLSNGDWMFTWTVIADATTLIRFEAGAGFAGDPLVVYSNSTLECFIEKRKPSHTIVLFAFAA